MDDITNHPSTEEDKNINTSYDGFFRQKFLLTAEYWTDIYDTKGGNKKICDITVISSFIHFHLRSLGRIRAEENMRKTCHHLVISC